jgi:hypothetical protein
MVNEVVQPPRTFTSRSTSVNESDPEAITHVLVPHPARTTP